MRPTHYALDLVVAFIDMPWKRISPNNNVASPGAVYFAGATSGVFTDPFERFGYSVRPAWRAAAAEWISLYLAERGSRHTIQIEVAWNTSELGKDCGWDLLVGVAVCMEFIDGDVWKLPDGHPLAQGKRPSNDPSQR